eukprot:1142049-Pelagomonas_calceolata.AAC.2
MSSRVKSGQHGNVYMQPLQLQIVDRQHMKKQEKHEHVWQCSFSLSRGYAEFGRSFIISQDSDDPKTIICNDASGGIIKDGVAHKLAFQAAKGREGKGYISSSKDNCQTNLTKPNKAGLGKGRDIKLAYYTNRNMTTSHV